MNVKGDANRRVRDTKARIKNTFLELIQEKRYSEITVTELSERANINRSTFYLYYKNVFDLIDKIENEFIITISEALDQISREDYIAGQHPQHIRVFNIILQNIKVYSILTSENGDIDFFHKLSEKMCDTLCRHWKLSCNNNMPTSLKLYSSYVVYGILGLFITNLRTNSPKSAEELGFFAGEVTNWIDEVFVKSYEYISPKSS